MFYYIASNSHLPFPAACHCFFSKAIVCCNDVLFEINFDFLEKSVTVVIILPNKIILKDILPCLAMQFL